RWTPRAPRWCWWRHPPCYRCSCYNGSKGQICAAVDNGAMTYEDIKSCTKASTGCGGCAQIVKDTLVSELKKRGIEVK
ncbi:(2Fe-2S)-binding protein, partial [Mycobacterium tuberculosis]|nr:(2Fe-2S)-binding protein [Mycobacterium tuberculosis]